MPVYELDGIAPTIADDVWIAPDAHVIGNVTLGPGVGVWFGAVLRGDNEPMTVGARTNIQEHAVVHSDPGSPARIGEDVTVGHRAIVHGATIGNGALVGMGAIVLNGAVVGASSLVGAGALVTEGKEFADGALIVGAPAKAVRDLDDGQRAALMVSAETYVGNAARFTRGLRRID